MGGVRVGNHAGASIGIVRIIRTGGFLHRADGIHELREHVRVGEGGVVGEDRQAGSTLAGEFRQTGAQEIFGCGLKEGRTETGEDAVPLDQLAEVAMAQCGKGGASFDQA